MKNIKNLINKEEDVLSKVDEPILEEVKDAEIH